MAASDFLADGPAIILVEPQLGENIGTAARAMANFGLGDLRLVNPRDGWPSDSARRASSRADHVLDRVRVFGSVAEAVADLRYIVATTARHREIAKTVRGPAAAAEIMRGHLMAGHGAGILFGRERTGLNNDDIAFADEIVTLPVDPRFASLNIAQAVLILAYEWRRSGLVEEAAGLRFRTPDQGAPASKEDLARLFEHLEGALDDVNFFRPVEKRNSIVLSLRAMLQRAQLAESEVRTLRGVIAALEGRKTRPRFDKNGVLTTSREGKE